MYPLTQNPTVRVWREESTGRIMQVETNIAPELKVEFVDVPDGECIASVNEKIEGSYPFQVVPYRQCLMASSHLPLSLDYGKNRQWEKPSISELLNS